MSNTIVIPEDFELTTQQVADMLGIDRGRVQTLIAKHNSELKIARTVGGPKGPGHYRVPFKKVERIKQLHETTRQIGVNKKAVSSFGPMITKNSEDIETLFEMVSATNERLNELAQFIDEYTAPEVAPPSATR